MVKDETVDVLLLSKMAKGDLYALDIFYQEYVRRVYSVVLRIIPEVGEAEELVQDLFLKIWGKSGSYNPELGSVCTWVLTITHRLCIDKLRKKARRPNLISMSEEIELFFPSSGDDDLHDHAWVSMQQEQVRTALRKLPPKQREVLYFAYFKGYTHVEIAEKFGEPLGTIKGRIRLAMENLRLNLDNYALERELAVPVLRQETKKRKIVLKNILSA